ncbi:MAG TPA: hypothetical protein H9756_03815 [Candidatus Mediterraneibacter gallistercoris]|uniref:Uncharacterized protein n=1 Tax=Candidatus Mediterraneibacter gallistercoris TaxID=2838671 RepID=A0A9D2T296_9FIRM|nr:hypothetical protein [Candidatus Mediterraneibacter gallistercoris]
MAHTQVLGGNCYNDVIICGMILKQKYGRTRRPLASYWPPTKEDYAAELGNRKQGLLEEISRKTSVSKVHYIYV